MFQIFLRCTFSLLLLLSTTERWSFKIYFKKKHLERILFPYSPQNLNKLENEWIKDIGAEIVDIKVWIIIQFIICWESSGMLFLLSVYLASPCHGSLQFQSFWIKCQCFFLWTLSSWKLIFHGFWCSECGLKSRSALQF